MAAVLSDPGLHAFTGGAPASAEELRARYARQVAGSPDAEVRWCNWVIRLNDGGPHAPLTGYVQATLAPDGDGKTFAEVAWVVGTPWQGRGIASEAARALVGRLRREPVDVVVAHVHPRHHASAAVAAAAGLRRTGPRRDGEIRWEWRRPAR
jgi:RimJ/RimL family protein N-acetyltransferase